MSLEDIPIFLGVSDFFNLEGGAMKGTEILVGKLKLNPLKETSLGVAQALFDPKTKLY